MFGNQPQQQVPAEAEALEDIQDISLDEVYAHYNALVKERSHGILSYRPNKIKIDLGDHSNAEDPRGIDYEGQQYFYHQDHIGSSSYLTDDNGEVHEFFAYFPSGETWVDQSGAFGTDYKFTGKELDKETGLYYFGARYYDPRTQVWQSPDPILGSYLDGERGMGGVYNPPNLNLSAYTHNNPVNLIVPEDEAAQVAAASLCGPSVAVCAGITVLGTGAIYISIPHGREQTGEVLSSIGNSISSAWDNIVGNDNVHTVDPNLANHINDSTAIAMAQGNMSDGMRNLINIAEQTKSTEGS
ncbi:RHS repeat domain-containing protein [Psychrobacter sp. I-STPA10]|uniref:RHS repeat domain-containing protein n=1 Tax=Psychrobacter sp. I-STPA10 TaxID=2585769 RepID=UPI001E2DA89C|nr:RHS repeat-associated core domain-containing protein [Psychrobacter sp. I-STPA10]